ncbi:hypothetical protein MP228_011327 [Amoeboaphelidium protococcarum]|nr:hypothetical protein MP228_011327 [Amoeboaphelidium protococcarum]
MSYQNRVPPYNDPPEFQGLSQQQDDDVEAQSPQQQYDSLNQQQQQQQQPITSKYETALPIRIDIEAALCYALGVFSGILFLVFEYKNAYVRFHAYQSSLVFVTMLLFHLIFTLASLSFTWLLYLLDVGLIVGLMYKAYINGQTLVRYRLPFFGDLADRWTESDYGVTLD